MSKKTEGKKGGHLPFKTHPETMPAGLRPATATKPLLGSVQVYAVGPELNLPPVQKAKAAVTPTVEALFGNPPANVGPTLKRYTRFGHNSNEVEAFVITRPADGTKTRRSAAYAYPGAS